MQLPSDSTWHSLFCWQSAVERISQARRQVWSWPTHLHSLLDVHVDLSPMELQVRAHSRRLLSQTQSES